MSLSLIPLQVAPHRSVAAALARLLSHLFSHPLRLPANQGTWHRLYVASFFFWCLPAFQCFFNMYLLSHFPFALTRTPAPVTHEDIYRFMDCPPPTAISTFFLKPEG